MSPFKKYFHHWAEKRSPRATQVILRHKTIYILPGKQGLAFLLVILLIWLLGTNYQNNLILAFAFFLVSIMLISTIHAFRNMLGVTFSPVSLEYSAVGELAQFNVDIGSRYSSEHHSLLLVLENSEPVLANLGAGLNTQVTLGVLARDRGWLKMPRITVKSYFPFGFIRAWAYVQLEHRALIYPRSVACDIPPLGAAQGEYGNSYSSQQGDEFHGFRAYQQGAPLSQVAWKQYARGAGLHLKDYRAHKSQQYWLDWQHISARDVELGLSQMSYWVNQFTERNIEFGLLLPGEVVDMGCGDIHRLHALRALALFGGKDSE